ncbi:MAG: M28 family peptidase [Bacteroidota bacterium]
MHKKKYFFSIPFIVLQLVCFSTSLLAQPEINWIRTKVSELCDPIRFGRGYVENGIEHGAKYMTRQFKEMGLKPLGEKGTYSQSYYFNVNTFPDTMVLSINNYYLRAGIDYLIDASSSSFYENKMNISTIDLDLIQDSTEWKYLKAKWLKKNHKEAYCLLHTDSLCKRMNIKTRKLAYELPEGCFIIPQHGKLTWTVSTQDVEATVFYVEDTVLPKHLNKASVAVHARYLGGYENQNIIAKVPGTIPDSFIVFTAHYDHLGMMGSNALFPGASDNASGSATMLYLAKYFARHPQKYTVVFIAFSGEEAGLQGSDYFVKHPLIPLKNIKFLTNIDIMGDATDGITVVNATEYSKEFSLLQQINIEKHYLPQIKSRGKAANSDHYHFSEAGVPAFFIYSNSGKGYYHDVFDKAATLTFRNVDGVLRLLIDFTTALQQ